MAQDRGADRARVLRRAGGGAAATDARVSEPLPLEVQVALDLLAPPFNRATGPALVHAPSAAVASMARAWVDGSVVDAPPAGMALN